MVQHFIPPQLPMSYVDIKKGSAELTDELTSRLVPGLCDFLGLTPPRITQRKSQQARRRVERFLINTRGYLLAMMVLGNEVPPPIARYAVLEGVLRQQLLLAGRRLRAQDDACVVVLRDLEKLAARPRRGTIPGYDLARDAVDDLADLAVRHGDDVTLNKANAEWTTLDEAKKVSHHARRLQSAINRWRWRPPARLTTKLIDELSSEYRESASSYEILLARLVGLAGVVAGRPVVWKRLYRKRLVDLQRAARRETTMPCLAVLAGGIDRDVRNVFAHGHVTMNLGQRVVEFRSRGRLVARWTATEFYENTRCLSAFVLAMLKFDEQLNFARVRGVYSALAFEARSLQEAVADAQGKAPVG